MGRNNDARDAARIDDLTRSRPLPSADPGPDHYGRRPPQIDFGELAEQIREVAPRPLDEIAALVRALTYGEMMQLAEGLWNANGQKAEISKDDLPGRLHQWSTHFLKRSP